MNAKKPLINLAVFLLSCFVILYAIIQLISGLTTDVSYEYASEQKIETALEKNAYIIRNESIVYTDKSGVLSYSVRESEKIGVDDLIASVYASQNGINLQNQINEIEKKIEILSDSSIDTGYLTSNISKIDERIFESLVETRSAMENNDLTLISSYKEELLIDINKRQLVTAGKADFSDQINDLQAEKDKLTSSLQNPLSTVYAEKPGYFSTLLDGYETVFTPERIKNMSLADYDKLVSEEKASYTDSAIGKLVTDFDWHSICEVTTKEAEKLVVGNTYPISFLYSSGRQIDAVLQRKISQTDSTRVILIFHIQEVPSDFDYTRYQPVKIITESKNGVSFPSSALRMVDGVQGVYIVAGNVIDFKKVDIISSTESRYLSRSFAKTDPNSKEYLSKFDRVVLEGKDLYVGKILD